MDDLAREIINQYQGGVPITERPFVEMAKNLNSDECSVMRRINRLLDDKNPQPLWATLQRCLPGRRFDPCGHVRAGKRLLDSLRSGQ